MAYAKKLNTRLIEGTGVNFNYIANPPDEAGLEAHRTRGYVDFGREIGVVE